MGYLEYNTLLRSRYGMVNVNVFNGSFNQYCEYIINSEYIYI